jgi:hypothetical protein
MQCNLKYGCITVAIIALLTSGVKLRKLANLELNPVVTACKSGEH